MKLIRRAPMQILVIEDETRLARLIQRGLEEEGHTAIIAADGAEGLSLALAHPFDVIVLDIMLPRLDGLSVAKRLRESGNRTPILMLTARDSDLDIVTGLDSGADDYLTKPFSFDVLLARIRAVSRRGDIPRPTVLRCADLTLDPATREAQRGPRRITLTRTEYALLEMLLRRAGHVVPRDTLLDAVWGFSSDVESNTLDAFMRLLRAKVELPGEPKLIHTVRGVGYTLREDPA